MQGEDADLVGVRLPCFAIDPVQQRRNAFLVIRVREEVDEQRHAPSRLVDVAIHRVARRLPVAHKCGDDVANVRGGRELPVQVRRVATNGEVELRAEALPQLSEALVKSLDDSHLRPERTRARHDQDDRPGDRGNQAIDRHRPLRVPDRAPRERLHQAGYRPDVRPFELLEQPVGRIRQSEPERRADVSIPHPEQHFAQPTPLALGGDHDVHPPGARHLAPLDRQLDGHCRVLPDDGRSLARDPDLRLAAGIVRVTAVLPVPSQPAGLGRVSAEDASIQRFDSAPVVRSVTIDVGERHSESLGPWSLGPGSLGRGSLGLKD